MKTNVNNLDFNKILQDLMMLHEAKSDDYSPSDPYSNMKECAKLGVRPWIGAMVRIMDKVARLQTAANYGNLKCESVEDTFKDLANYAIIGLILYRQEEYERDGSDRSHPEDEDN